jgi:DNA-binding transcriptional LysR family regulator
MLNLYKLEIFALVAQQGSFSAAAGQLYLSQSAVSQHIQDLEASLGTALFTRGRRGVALTPAGETLYDYTRRILALLAEAESAVVTVENLAGGQVSIGSTPGASLYLLPGWIHTFRSRYPHLTVSLETGVTGAIAAGVLGRRLDVGFVEGDVEGSIGLRLGQLVLAQVAQYVVIGPDHPCWACDAVPAARLDGQPFITRQPNSQTRAWQDALLAAHGVQPRIVAELDSPESIKRAVMSGMGAAILPDYAVQREAHEGALRALPLAEGAMQRALRLIWNDDAPCTPLTRAFLTQMSGEYPPLAGFLAGR